MKNKSDRSFEAGNKLIASKFYTQSIHCFYYSVLQMMMYKLSVCKDSPLNYERQKEKEKEKLFNTSTHDWLFSEVRSKLNRPSRVIFSEEFKRLKARRIDADYGESTFDVIQSLECKEKAEILLGKLRDIN